MRFDVSRNRRNLRERGTTINEVTSVLDRKKLSQANKLIY
jgi:hypothetical protein